MAYSNGNPSSPKREHPHKSGFMTQQRSRKSSRPSTAPEYSHFRNNWPTRVVDLEANEPSDIATPSTSMQEPVNPSAFLSADYDWATFITAYASGHWDPLKTPNRPRSCQQIIADSYFLPSFETRSTILTAPPPVLNIPPPGEGRSQAPKEDTTTSKEPEADIKTSSNEAGSSAPSASEKTNQSTLTDSDQLVFAVDPDVQVQSVEVQSDPQPLVSGENRPVEETAPNGQLADLTDRNSPTSTACSSDLSTPLIAPKSPLHPDSNIKLESPSQPYPQYHLPPPKAHSRGRGINGLTISSSGPMKSHPALPLRLPLPTHRFKGGLSPAVPGVPQQMASSGDVHTAVATMRWAAARVDISPLALPSPEHELTDPMRGVVAALPGSYVDDSSVEWYPATPGGTRRSRLNTFWEGTTDIQEISKRKRRLSSIIASPPDSQVHSIIQSDHSPPAVDSPPHVPVPVISASVPIYSLYHNTGGVTNDYFGDAVADTSLPKAAKPSTIQDQGSEHDSPKTPTSSGCSTHSMRTNTSATTVTPPATLFQQPRNSRAHLPTQVSANSVPVLPRRVSLTRQTSSPYPETAMVLDSSAWTVGKGLSDMSGGSGGRSISSLRLGRAAKEERMFDDIGYLAPPNPPEEMERRRALNKFNIWNTGADINFDRIAHLAKLVFSTKGVMISLIDGNEQWCKSHWGMNPAGSSRAHSFCGHAILQRGDEPMIILDTHKDWRFQKNPLVTGSPNIRFYAGAPLRTVEGYNIGTLSVVDDQPREEFTPRQRHTLKEFAAIAMREMELWRDKIQLRIRDRIQTSMEEFSRECLEIDAEIHDFDRSDLAVGSSMDRVYDRAAKLVKRTLDVEGVIVMDVSHCEVLENMNLEGSVSVAIHHGEQGQEVTQRQLTTEEYHRLHVFFEKNPEGSISEGIIPSSFKPFLPTHVQYALTVPIFNIDKRPFALLCAYNAQDHKKRFLEGHELSYLRAIGVIILSAVLKRRMILADKAKGLFISNISHELRTPLHGILAAAELLSESHLNHSQTSFLQTVQACGTSLVETVNHVLDFTKLSGGSKSVSESVIVPSTVDIMQLVEEAIDGCWIGHCARIAVADDSGIGSVYSPPKQNDGEQFSDHVETVVDIGYRSEGWTLKCEKGGIRRVLMNLYGNSLKFTTNGFIHVRLRQLPSSEDDPPNKVKIELAVSDTGKGISQNFLKNQLFHPFSQENPLQTGTGLGLAIVSSIVTSDAVGGKVDVWSEEGAGTEIKVTFFAEVPDVDQKLHVPEMEPFFRPDDYDTPTVSLIGFDNEHKGVQLLSEVLRTYLTTWWGFKIVDDGDIIILNDDPRMIVAATERRDISKGFIILSAARGNPEIMAITSEHERIGGFCRMLSKPGGPSRLRAILKLSLHALSIARSSSSSSAKTLAHSTSGGSVGAYLGTGQGSMESLMNEGGYMPARRNSEEPHSVKDSNKRPGMSRSSTAHAGQTRQWSLPATEEQQEILDPEAPVPAITINGGGTLLKSSLGTVDVETRSRVLVVEDNSILRNLLIRWLSAKNYDFRSAVDGVDGVNTYRTEGPFDIVLLDMSMPNLGGVGATVQIRELEEDLAKMTSDFRPTRILALTGMSSLEDKRRAFEAGVDGYLVKPVAFKTLDEMFHKLGLVR